MPAMRDLYVLIIGVVLGVLLGPAVLGQFAPSGYDVLFGSVREDVAVIEEFDRETAANLNRLIETGVTQTEVVRFGQQREMARGALVAQWRGHEAKRFDKSVGRVNAIVLVLIALMVLEMFLPGYSSAGGVGGEVGGALSRKWLGGAWGGRVVLLAMWLALVLANPALLRGVSWVFVGVLLVVVLVGGMVKGETVKR